MLGDQAKENENAKHKGARTIRGNMSDISKRLSQISIPPSENEAFDAWVEGKDAIALLKDNARYEDFIVYASSIHTFMHAIVVPASKVTPPNVEDLLEWSCNPSESWGISYKLSDPPEVSISPPLADAGSKTLACGEQLVFSRSFDGRVGERGYFEVLQKFAHLFDLHFLAERKSYCRLDKLGDVEDVIRIVSKPKGAGDIFGETVITFNRELLDRYLALTDSVLVQTFDFTRFRPSEFRGWPQSPDTQQFVDGDLYYRSFIASGYGSFIRGFQIVRSQISKEKLFNPFGREHEGNREYASFIAYDWKNGVVTEISCAPGRTANYFTKSKLPYETSPAFFRPEVLLKYKLDSEKYRLQDRSISCRGAWHLQTYDINEVGQVHTYIAYLQALPYEEQLYWKAHNEPPKGPISKRAVKTDFEGDWDLDYDPLISLRTALLELSRKSTPWWTLRSAKLPDQVHYPATSSSDEWSNEILQLDQFVVEGFEETWLRKTAQSVGRSPDPKFRSVKLIEECLIGLGFEEEHASQITEPLRNLHNMRSKLKGHAAGEEAAKVRQAALAEHGSYRAHFRVLCEKCDKSIRILTEIFEKIRLDKSA
jgi:hypothetical protein